MSSNIGINPKTLKPYKVAFADDSAPIRMLLKRYLQMENFEIVGEWENGREIIFKMDLLKEKPDILITDLDMPDKSGIDAIKELKPLYPDLKIIIVSSMNQKEIIEELLKLQINIFIKKPFDRIIVMEKISTALKLNQSGAVIPTNAKQQKEAAKKLTLNELSIPPIPNLVHEILKFDSEQGTGGSAELEMLIAPDQSISADILRLARSSYYGRPESVKSLRDAITLLGIKTIKNMILLKSNKSLYEKLNKETYKRYLQEHSILTALISSDLATPLGLKRIKEELFLSGLLRKIGMTVLALNYNKEYLEIINHSEIDKADLYELEKKEFNFSSIDVGMKVFKLWNMPEVLKNVIANQNFKSEDVVRVSDYDRINRLGDILANQMIGLPVNDEMLIIQDKLFSIYGHGPESNYRTIFNEKYYEAMKQHPVYELALSFNEDAAKKNKKPDNKD